MPNAYMSPESMFGVLYSKSAASGLMSTNSFQWKRKYLQGFLLDPSVQESMIFFLMTMQNGGRAALWLHAYQSLGVVYGDLGKQPTLHVIPVIMASVLLLLYLCM